MKSWPPVKQKNKAKMALVLEDIVCYGEKQSRKSDRDYWHQADRSRPSVAGAGEGLAGKQAQELGAQALKGLSSHCENPGFSV